MLPPVGYIAIASSLQSSQYAAERAYNCRQTHTSVDIYQSKYRFIQLFFKEVMPISGAASDTIWTSKSQVYTWSQSILISSKAAQSVYQRAIKNVRICLSLLVHGMICLRNPFIITWAYIILAEWFCEVPSTAASAVMGQ